MKAKRIIRFCLTFLTALGLILVITRMLSGGTGARRRTWGVRIPVQLDNISKPPNVCVEQALRRRFSEVSWSKEGRVANDYGQAIHFKSPVAYDRMRETWLTVAFERLNDDASLSFSDDWVGEKLAFAQVDSLAQTIAETAREIAAECAVKLSDAPARCETFPRNEPCPLPKHDQQQPDPR